MRKVEITILHSDEDLLSKRIALHREQCQKLHKANSTLPESIFLISDARLGAAIWLMAEEDDRLYRVINAAQDYLCHQVTAAGVKRSDACASCGGTMLGDGVTVARHCEFVELPDDCNAISGPIYCTR